MPVVCSNLWVQMHNWHYTAVNSVHFEVIQLIILMFPKTFQVISNLFIT